MQSKTKFIVANISVSDTNCQYYFLLCIESVDCATGLCLTVMGSFTFRERLEEQLAEFQKRSKASSLIVIGGNGSSSWILVGTDSEGRQSFKNFL